MMTRRERLRRCYFNEALDRPGVYSRTGFPGNDPTYDQLKAYLREHSELKAWWSSYHLEKQPPREAHTERYSEEFDRLVDIIHTPKGDLRRVTLVSLKSEPGMIEERFLKEREDAERYLSLPPRKIGGDVLSFFETDRRMGDTGIVDIGLAPNPAGRIVEMFGSELFAMMTLTDRDLLHEMCRREMGIAIENVKYLLAQKVGPYFGLEGQEYLVPPMHSPADFEEFSVKYDKPIVDLIHDGGGRVHVHCHGQIRKVFPLLLKIGADVLHPFEGPPMSDLTPAEAKALAQGKLCLEGNIQINRMYERTPKEIADETRALIREAFSDHKGLIVCPTASPYLVGRGEQCFPQYKAMIDTVLACKA